MICNVLSTFRHSTGTALNDITHGYSTMFLWINMGAGIHLMFISAWTLLLQIWIWIIFKLGGRLKFVKFLMLFQQFFLIAHFHAVPNVDVSFTGSKSSSVPLFCL